MTAEEMRARKRELGYSNRELANAAGLPVATVQKIMSGATKAPRRAAVEALEKALCPKSETYRILRSASHDISPEQSEVYPGSHISSIVAERPFLYTGSSFHQSASSEVWAEGIGAKAWPKQGNYTLEDYYALPAERRAELIDGVLYDMAAPSAVHQEILLALAFQLKGYVKNNKGACRVFVAPYDVQLNQDEKTVVQPDITILCDPGKSRKSGCIGAPDFIVEILSPSTAQKDILVKLRKYMTAGVREYWIVNPESRRVTVCLNRREETVLRMYSFSDNIPVDIWQGQFLVDFAEIYEDVAYSYELKE